MTTSIVFDASCNYEPEYLDANRNDVDNSEILGMTKYPREALERLRFLKTRETGDDVVIPITTGRDRRLPPDFNTISYYERKMRRKAGVLMEHNKNKQSSKSSFASLSKTPRTKFKSMTNARIRALRQSQQCVIKVPIIKPSSNSGVMGGKDLLIFDPNIPFEDNL